MCPVCGEPLVAFELEGVEIDRCVGCGGTWLDAGELEQITELAGVTPGRLSDALQAAGAGKHGKRRCPRCGRKLHVITVGDQPAVEIDRCPQGDGLWLDAHEMQAVVSSFAGEGEAGAVARFFADLYGHELNPKAEGE
jgi:Zn-finger nucleic acid-binding protein